VKSRILSLDTTSEHGSLALVDRGEIAGELVMHSTEGFGHLLYSHIGDLLAAHGWLLTDVDAFAAAAGPGSFTGIRVGLAAVKGLGAALGRPVVGVSNLLAVAWHGSAHLRAALIDARRDEVYAAVYSDSLQPVHPEVVTALPRWLESLPVTDVELISTDADWLTSAVAGTPYHRFPIRQAPKALAGAVGSIACARLAAGLAVVPAAVEANYVRRSDAELFWKEP
jgi:tRNA threonylcarbamoyladenosine biosynthesis protein TsaB